MISAILKVTLYTVDKIQLTPPTQALGRGNAVLYYSRGFKGKFLLKCSPRVSSRGSLKEVLNKEKTVSF